MAIAEDHKRRRRTHSDRLRGVVDRESHCLDDIVEQVIHRNRPQPRLLSRGAGSREQQYVVDDADEAARLADDGVGQRPPIVGVALALESASPPR